MNFSKTTSYAITILHFLAVHREERFSAKKLNQELGIPWPYLRQLLTALSKEGLIDSMQGRSGGFTLQHDPSGITLNQIVEAVEGKDSFRKCIMGFKDCPFDYQCAMHSVWEDSRKTIQKVLNETTLSNLIK